MTPARSAFALRTTALAVAALALLSVLAPGLRAIAAPGASDKPAFVASLVPESPAVPVGEDFSYTADIRLPSGASYLQAVFELARPGGEVLFRRTKVTYGIKPKGRVRYEFARDLTGPLALEAGDYPVKLTLTGTVLGATETTEVAGSLRVYPGSGTHVHVALIARVNGQPMTSPDGRFAVDPGQATGARDAVSRVSQRVLADPRAHVTLSVPPVLLAEWRRLSGGYTLADGTSVRPDAPVSVAYNAALADLKSAMDTGRLKLANTGYADPNLTDLADHGLAKDVGAQYDAGISAVFASIEATPSGVSAPAGGCVPPNQVSVLALKGVRALVVDEDCTRQGKSHAASGPYKLSHETLRTLVVESTTTAALSRADTETAMDRAFQRLVRQPKQPLVMSVEVDGDSNPATDTVGAALDAIEAQPWLQLGDADDLKPAASESPLRLLAGKKTPHAPKSFWKTVIKSRTYAAGYLAALGSSDTGATTAEIQSLVGEAASWSEPDNEWSTASRGLAFARASLSATRDTLDRVTMKVESLTLSGSSGNMPITIVNGSEKALDVTVHLSTTGGVRLAGPADIKMTLSPQENYFVVPVTMQRDLAGQLNVEVLAGTLVIARSKADVQASYLDRLAIVGLIVLMGIGVLVFIVRRVRSTQDVPQAAVSGEPYDWIEEIDEDDASAR